MGILLTLSQNIHLLQLLSVCAAQDCGVRFELSFGLLLVGHVAGGGCASFLAARANHLLVGLAVSLLERWVHVELIVGSQNAERLALVILEVG